MVHVVGVVVVVVNCYIVVVVAIGAGAVTSAVHSFSLRSCLFFRLSFRLINLLVHLVFLFFSSPPLAATRWMPANGSRRQRRGRGRGTGTEKPGFPLTVAAAEWEEGSRAQYASRHLCM